MSSSYQANVNDMCMVSAYVVGENGDKYLNLARVFLPWVASLASGHYINYQLARYCCYCS